MYKYIYGLDVDIHYTIYSLGYANFWNNDKFHLVAVYECDIYDKLD